MSYTPPEIPSDVQKVAKKFFERAMTVSDTRNYDYAVELMIQGLTKDPQAIKDGYVALREIGIKRLATGGKKAGFMEAMKHGTSNKKNPTQAMLNAGYLLAKDPLNVMYIEAFVKNADQAELPEAMFWGLKVFLDLARRDKKPNLNRLLTIKGYSEKLGDYFDEVGENEKAIACYENGVEALEIGLQTDAGRNQDFMSLQRNLAGRLTILRGKYNTADSFRDSIKNADEQKYLQDKTRKVMGEEQQTDVIAKARKELEENPNVTGKINTLIDLLLQRGKVEDEDEAISILEAYFKNTNEYNYKKRADDIRMRKANRLVASLNRRREEADTPELKAQQEEAVAQMEKLELGVFKERIAAYPTEAKLKYEYGRRLYRTKQYDEAIPVLQESTADPKYAVRARHFIGACFFQKEWFQQAIDILSQALDSHETPEDATGKDISYLLGRSYESDNQKDKAMAVFNKLIQIDFNYRDVRKRIDDLRK